MFADDSASIREAFERLVNLYTVPGSETLPVDNADPTRDASEDILGRQRGPAPDFGAYKLEPLGDTVLTEGFED